MRKLVTIIALILTLAVTTLGDIGTKTAQAGVSASQQTWQYKWQVWLPYNWQLLGACETGYGKRPGNWNHHNSSYVSAFGIQRGNKGGQYDDDARKAGMPPWNDANPPTPWQQFKTAQKHLQLYGDGWGCPGP